MDSRLVRPVSLTWAPVLLALAITSGCGGGGDEDTNAPETGFSSTGGTDTAQTEPADTEVVETETTPPTATDSDASSTLDPSADSTGPAAAVCGDGEVEGDEVCDDGNGVDGDGCNEGCVASGSPVWTWSAGEQAIADMAVAENGSIFVAVVEPEALGGHIVELSSDGREMGSRELPIPDAPSGGTLDFRISSIDTIDSQPVYTSEARYLDADGEIETVRQTVQLFGPDGWMLEGEGVVRQGIASDPGGRLVGFHGDEVVEYDDAGETVWTAPLLGGDGVWPRIGGGAFAFDRLRVVALDGAGEPLWAIDETDNDMTRFHVIVQAPDETLLAMQEIADGEPSIGRLWAVDSEGEVISTEDFDTLARAMAVDPEGNLFLPIESEVTLAKLTADYDEIWTFPQGGPPIIDVEVDPEGAAVVALRDDTVSKLAF